MVTLTSFVIVQQHFKKFRALAAAISGCGLSIGTLFAGPLLSAMLNAFRWRGTLLLMSAMVLNCCVFGGLYRPPPAPSPRRRQKDDENSATGNNSTFCGTMRHLLKDLTDLSIFYNAPFSLVCVGSLMMNFGLLVFLQHTPSRAVVLGIERRLSYLLPTVSGITLLAGRIVGGIVGNLSCTNRLLQYGVNIVVGGVVLVLLGNLVTFVPLAMFGAAAGFAAGMFCAL